MVTTPESIFLKMSTRDQWNLKDPDKKDAWVVRERARRACCGRMSEQPVCRVLDAAGGPEPPARCCLLEPPPHWALGAADGPGPSAMT